MEAGYRLVTQVEEHGEFAVRGSILDLYPMSSGRPFRVEFFDDEVETIRTFDPDSQRGLDKTETISLVPAHEFPLNEEGIATFRRGWRNAFDAASRNAPLYRDVSEGRAPAGIEYYLPLFFEESATLFDYLPGDAGFVHVEGALAGLAQFAESTAERFEQRRHDVERPVLPPETLYLSAEEVRERLAAHATLETQRYEIEKAGAGTALNLPTAAPGLYPIEPRGERPMGAFADFAQGFDGRVLVVAESTGRREALLDQLVGNRLTPETVAGWQAFLASDRPLCLTTAPLDRGLVLPEAKLALVGEGQLGAGRVKRRERRRPTRDSDAIIANLNDLALGDPVVHIDHGVGRYEGLTSLAVGAVANEYLTLRYAGDDKLYVPVSSLHLISRYTGASADAAPLHKLGSEAWQKARRRAAEKAYDIAAELLEIHARRAAKKGFSFPDRSNNYAAFAAAFPFEETPDQLRAIDAVVEDLRSPRPMDRVVCGDVGFGKTEVAMRAAFVAVDAGKQVAVLVPTTLLARQHYRNFLDRFADWPVQIESISRFDTAKEQKAILGKLATGGIDIVIGTHKLLGRDIAYRDLGLVIIDEEHRFGVRHKEHMKALRAGDRHPDPDRDADPAHALDGSRRHARSLDHRHPAPAPPRHQDLRRRVGRRADPRGLRARARPRRADLLPAQRGADDRAHRRRRPPHRARCPRARRPRPDARERARAGHGRLPPSALQRAGGDHDHRERHRHPLGQHHPDQPRRQARPRPAPPAARARRALPPPRLRLPDHPAAGLDDAGRGQAPRPRSSRSRTSASASPLATHDLEIRGAGELLGEDQSGQIQAIGFTLYTELLDRAVKALKAGKLPDHDRPLAQGTEVDLGSPALLPEDYVPDVHQRLIFYKRIANADGDEGPSGAQGGDDRSLSACCRRRLCSCSRRRGCDRAARRSASNAWSFPRAAGACCSRRNPRSIRGL